MAVLVEGLRERLGPLFEAFAEPLYVWERDGDGDGDLVLVGCNDAAARLPVGRSGELLGRRAREVYADLPHVLADLEACARAGSLQREIGYVFRASTQERRLLVSYTRVEPDLVVVSTRDVTELWERARQERERAAELEQVTALTQALLESQEPQQSRDLLCETARRLAGADVVYLLEPVDGDLAQTAAACSSGAPTHEPIRVDGRSLSSQVFTAGEGVFVPDVLDDERTSLDAYQKSGMQAGFFQPVVAADRVVGVLVVGWAHPSPAPPQLAARLMPVLTSQAGAVILRTDHIAQLTELAGRDALTGLPNRRSWDEELERTLALSRRHGTPLCVVVLDVNGLKEVNDREGHRAGDDLLREAARLWEAQLRAEDFLARLGGDEFGVLVPGLRRVEAERIVRRLTEAGAHLSAAAGVAEWDGSETAAGLVHRADAAMYVVKRSR